MGDTSPSPALRMGFMSHQVGNAEIGSTPSETLISSTSSALISLTHIIKPNTFPFRQLVSLTEKENLRAPFTDFVDIFCPPLPFPLHFPGGTTKEAACVFPCSRVQGLGQRSDTQPPAGGTVGHGAALAWALPWVIFCVWMSLEALGIEPW